LGIFYLYQKKSDSRTIASQNTKKIIDFEKKIGIYWEKSLQNLIKNNISTIKFFSLWYNLMNYPLAISILIYLYFFNINYSLVISCFFLMNIISIYIYGSWPAMPPRLYGECQIDDICHKLNHSKIEESIFHNHYAAMPSMHSGYQLFLLITLYLLYDIYFIPAIFTIIMAICTIVTGHHFIVDIICGYLVAIISTIPMYFLAK
jgi:membrane-associated phospholipid phosphatase